MEKKLKKLLESTDNQIYITTLEDCIKWFKILNKILFNNSLTPLKGIDIRKRRGAHGYYYEERLLMNSKYKTKRFFVEILAHEMVHHYQYLYNREVDHGPTFLIWTGRFREKGINLVSTYVREHEDQQKPL